MKAAQIKGYGGTEVFEVTQSVVKIKIHIDKVFALDEIKEAFKHQEEGHPNGKIILKIS